MFRPVVDQEGVERAVTFRSSVRIVLAGPHRRVHDLVGFDGLGDLVFAISPGAEAPAVKGGHVELGLAVHHPLRHVFPDSALGDADAGTAEIPKIF